MARGNEASGLERAQRIHGDGEMARRIREKDWSATALGPLGAWSDSLVATLNLILASSETFAVYWGAEQILLYNDEYRKLLDVKHPAALGRSGPEVWAEAWTLIGPQIQAAFERGETTSVAEALIPILVGDRLQDGWFSYSFHPVYEDGRIVAVGNPGRDITASVQARMALSASEARLGQLLDATTDAVVGVGRDWRITYMNPAAERVYGQGRGLVGCALWEEFPGAAYEGSPYVEHYERAMHEGIAGSFEASYGEPLNIWIHLEVYPTADGIVVFSQDVTQKRLAQAALIQNEKLAAVGRLASSIAHEINNPLEAVTNLLYLARTSDDVAEMRTYLMTADLELRRTSAIASQTLRFHRQATRRIAVTCDDLIGSVLGIHQTRLMNARVRVEKRKRAMTPVLCFDGEIRQVLSNLVSNAIDAMGGTGGRLVMRSREGHDWGTGRSGLVITVADTGPGMAKAVLGKLFSAFFTTKGIGGTGLGLWISQEIVERHRGRIRLRSSQMPGHTGTVFTVFLPFEAAGSG